MATIFLDILFPLGNNWSGSYRIYRLLFILMRVQEPLPAQEAINPIAMQELTLHLPPIVLGPCPFIFFFILLINLVLN